jgi:hypothetical protein
MKNPFEPGMTGNSDGGENLSMVRWHACALQH